MAKVTAGAGYKELTKVGDYISPNINAAADRIAKQGMQQKQINADAKARQEERDHDWAKEAQVDMTNFEVEVTGNADLTGMFVGAAQGGAAKAGKLYGEARALQNIDRKTAEGKKAEAQLVELSFKNLATQSKELKPILDAYAKDYADGKIKEKSYKDGYMLRIGMPDGSSVDKYDPYSFSPQITGFDLQIWGEGNHEKAYSFMGAHLREINGIKGVSEIVANNGQKFVFGIVCIF